MTAGQIYPFLNAAHILAIGLLVGAVLPMDLRLMGAFSRVPLPVLVPFLSRCAGVGLGLAIVTGAILFAFNPGDYLGNTAFRVKLALLAAGGVLIAVQHRNPGFRAALQGAGPPVSVRLTAAGSALVWLSVLLAGRWIGFL